MGVTVVSKSSTRVLIETFITDWSRTMTNCAVANATKGSHRFIDPPPPPPPASPGCLILSDGRPPEEPRRSAVGSGRPEPEDLAGVDRDPHVAGHPVVGDPDGVDAGGKVLQQREIVG